MKGITGYLMALLVATGAVFGGNGGTVPRPENKRVLCLGDSITHGGYCLYYLQLMENLRHPGTTTRYYNAGHSGGTIADCIYDDYAFEIARVNPDVVFTMFGMNDVGKAHYKNTPEEPSDELLAEIEALDATYRANYTNLIEKIGEKGVSEMVLVTPSPYDEYATNLYSLPNYWFDRLGLTKAAKSVHWVAAEKTFPYVELHAPMAALVQQYPKPYGEDEVWGWCGPDRVHPLQLGHLFMATQYLKAFGETVPVARLSLTAEGTVTRCDNATISNVRKEGDVLTFDYVPNALPFPKLAEYDLLKNYYPEIETVYNDETLKVTGLGNACRWHVLADGRPLGIFTNVELAQGVNLAELDTPNARIASKAAAIMYKLHDFDVTLRDRRLDDIHAEHRPTVFTAEELAKQETYYQAMAAVRPATERIEIRPCWFDAKIPQYAAWPEDATMAVGGVWTSGTTSSGKVTLDDDGALGIGGATDVTFEAALPKALTTDVDTVTVSSKLDAGVYPQKELPTVEASSKGGVLLATDGEGDFFFCGLAKVDDHNAWVRLVGPAAPSNGAPVTVQMTLAAKKDGVVVTYNINGTDYSYTDETEIPIVASDFEVSAVDYSGFGSVYTLAGDSLVPEPTALVIRKITKAEDGVTPVSAEITYGSTNFVRQLYVCWGADGGTSMDGWANRRLLGTISADSVRTTAVFPEDIRSALATSGFRLFIGYTTAADYEQDGLVVLYDGRENAGWNTHVDTATTWRNLKSDNRSTDLTLTGTAIGEDYVLFDKVVGGVTAGSVMGQDSDITLDAAVRAEFGPDDRAHQLIINLERLGGLGFFYYAWLETSNRWTDEQQLRWRAWKLPDDAPVVDDGNYHTLSAAIGHNCQGHNDQTDVRVEGTAVPRDGTWEGAFSGMPETWRLVVGHANVKAYIRSLRVYSRKLTAEEAAANAAVDKSRFEGGTPFHTEASDYAKVNQLGLFLYIK